MVMTVTSTLEVPIISWRELLQSIFELLFQEDLSKDVEKFLDV